MGRGVRLKGVGMEGLQETIRKVLGGDRDAYGDIVRGYQEMLLAYAAFRVPDPFLVDEVVQQTFIRAYQQLSEYKTDKDFGVWLRTICKFMILAELKRLTRDRQQRENYREAVRQQLLGTALQQEMYPDREILQSLNHCLERLQDRSRSLLVYRYQDALKIDDIARRVGQSVSWVATTLFRVRDTLRKCMEQQVGARVTG